MDREARAFTDARGNAGGRRNQFAICIMASCKCEPLTLICIKWIPDKLRAHRRSDELNSINFLIDVNRSPLLAASALIFIIISLSTFFRWRSGIAFLFGICIAFMNRNGIAYAEKCVYCLWCFIHSVQLPLHSDSRSARQRRQAEREREPVHRCRRRSLSFCLRSQRAWKLSSHVYHMAPRDCIRYMIKQSHYIWGKKP